MKKNFIKRLADKYVDGTISDKEKVLIESYFEHKQNQEADDISDSNRAQHILDRIHAQISANKNNRRSHMPYYWAAAAIVLLSIASLYIFKLDTDLYTQPSMVEVKTNKGEKKKVVLPDGSVVILNSGSQLHYASHFKDTVRKIDLQGEAYFDVVHDSKKPFIVHSEKMDVKVVGTLFNVKVYKGEPAEASLVKGAVQIFLPAVKKALITLKPDQKFTLGQDAVLVPSKQLVARGKDFIVTVPKELITSSRTKEIEWVHNRLSFDDQSFKEVAALLERWYDVTITIDNPELLKYRFTGTFNDTGLIDILDALKASQDFKYRKEGERINIY
ncbi:FecR family protein [Pedobacter terrae]|uniref:FecR family protein n=1 Tax=Pedobacter terrae TaxID=405671 RepID=UPI002FFB317D